MQLCEISLPNSPSTRLWTIRFCGSVQHMPFLLYTILGHSHTHTRTRIRAAHCSLARAQYCMLARSSGDADNCRRHDTCWRLLSSFDLSSICFSQNPNVRSTTQTVQSTQSTFTHKCTISVHIHHTIRFIYLLSLLTSSERIQKLL